MKKILMLVSVGSYSGAEHMSVIVCRELIRKGYDVVYCSPNGEICKYLEEEKIMYTPLKKFSIFEIYKILKKERPDLVHTVDYRVSMLLSLFKVPYVTHLHNNAPWIQKKSIFTLILLNTLNKSKGNICVSESILKEFVFATKIKNSNTQVIPNIIDYEKIKILSEEEEDDKFTFGFFGRITDEKDPIRFIELIRNIKEHIPNVNAIMVGSGKKDEVEKCKAYIKKYDLNIQMVGFQKNPYKFMKNVKIMLMPSKWEGFGLTAVEAMSLGIPVLGNGVGGLKDVLNNPSLICDSDQEYINQSLKLLYEKNYYLNVSDFVKENSLKYIDASSYIERIINVYEKR